MLDKHSSVLPASCMLLSTSINTRPPIILSLILTGLSHYLVAPATATEREPWARSISATCLWKVLCFQDWLQPPNQEPMPASRQLPASGPAPDFRGGTQRKASVDPLGVSRPNRAPWPRPGRQHLSCSRLVPYPPHPNTRLPRMP